MSAAEVALVVSTSLYAGFQMTVRTIVYPQFARVPAADFPAYEAMHRRRITFVVGPLFAFLAVTCVAALATRPDVWCAVSAACFAGILAVTAFAAVPQHQQLSAGFSASAHSRLLRADSVRVAFAALACAAAVVHAIRG